MGSEPLAGMQLAEDLSAVTRTRAGCGLQRRPGAAGGGLDQKSHACVLVRRRAPAVPGGLHEIQAARGCRELSICVDDSGRGPPPVARASRPLRAAGKPRSRLRSSLPENLAQAFAGPPSCWRPAPLAHAPALGKMAEGCRQGSPRRAPPRAAEGPDKNITGHGPSRCIAARSSDLCHQKRFFLFVFGRGRGTK